MPPAAGAARQFCATCGRATVHVRAAAGATCTQCRTTRLVVASVADTEMHSGMAGATRKSTGSKRPETIKRLPHGSRETTLRGVQRLLQLQVHRLIADHGAPPVILAHARQIWGWYLRFASGSAFAVAERTLDLLPSDRDTPRASRRGRHGDGDGDGESDDGFDVEDETFETMSAHLDDGETSASETDATGMSGGGGGGSASEHDEMRSVSSQTSSRRSGRHAWLRERSDADSDSAESAAGTLGGLTSGSDSDGAASRATTATGTTATGTSATGTTATGTTAAMARRPRRRPKHVRRLGAARRSLKDTTLNPWVAPLVLHLACTQARLPVLWQDIVAMVANGALPFWRAAPIVHGMAAPAYAHFFPRNTMALWMMEPDVLARLRRHLVRICAAHFGPVWRTANVPGLVVTLLGRLRAPLALWPPTTLVYQLLQPHLPRQPTHQDEVQYLAVALLIVLGHVFYFEPFPGRSQPVDPADRARRRAFRRRLQAALEQQRRESALLVHASIPQLVADRALADKMARFWKDAVQPDAGLVDVFQQIDAMWKHVPERQDAALAHNPLVAGDRGPASVRDAAKPMLFRRADALARPTWPCHTYDTADIGGEVGGDFAGVVELVGLITGEAVPTLFALMAEMVEALRPAYGAPVRFARGDGGLAAHAGEAAAAPGPGRPSAPDLIHRQQPPEPPRRPHPAFGQDIGVDDNSSSNGDDDEAIDVAHRRTRRRRRAHATSDAAALKPAATTRRAEPASPDPVASSPPPPSPLSPSIILLSSSESEAG
ncbi:hypothetical protein CXG81DRAFT_20252 [Caulochytrium protostelioides]|uniref:Uncharacterized protein n=1 Tax=Caulochytrium protostelioides TaxID=1555241 RepID=A0A4P9X3S9_9FUNG|nr:hypothetical protein CXG81DRAFT_20252 [Caulochytrium protostelioides]|eukprot:RKO99699.1 hypothetical protein CXG81DRAFT_20252 [Caulochytrium protostelioides]